MKVRDIEGMFITGVGVYPVHNKTNVYEVLVAIENGMEITFFTDHDTVKIIKRDVDNIVSVMGDDE